MDVKALYRQLEAAQAEVKSAKNAVGRAIIRVEKANRRLLAVEKALVETLRKGDRRASQSQPH